MWPYGVLKNNPLRHQRKFNPGAVGEFLWVFFTSFYKVNYTVSLSVYLGRGARFTMPQCISTISRWATLQYKAALNFSSRPTRSHFSPREFERITTTNNVHIRSKQYWPLYNRFKHNAVIKNQINHVSLNGWTLEPCNWVKQDWN